MEYLTSPRLGLERLHVGSVERMDFELYLITYKRRTAVESIER